MAVYGSVDKQELGKVFEYNCRRRRIANHNYNHVHVYVHVHVHVHVYVRYYLRRISMGTRRELYDSTYIFSTVGNKSITHAFQLLSSVGYRTNISDTACKRIRRLERGRLT